MNYLIRFKGYLEEVWGEVKPNEGKVSWPSADEVQGQTFVVIVTVGILIVFLGGVDFMFGRLISWLLIGF